MTISVQYMFNVDPSSILTHAHMKVNSRNAIVSLGLLILFVTYSNIANYH